MMKTTLTCLGALVISLGARDLSAQERARAAVLDRVEEDLRGIYERGQFRARQFSAKWLPGGYVVQGRNGGVKVDPETGESTPLTDADREVLQGGPRRSPSGRSVIESRGGGLRVRDLSSGRNFELTKTEDGVRHRDFSWSPDSRLIAFVEDDSRKLRFRNFLAPTDPSYPAARQIRFARVGEVIPALRVGVVVAAGGDVRWMKIPQPEEGFYLAQVAWAGNDTVLIEQLSRFRDQRTLWLANAESGEVTVLYRESDEAWVTASYGTNLGIEWLADGNEFLLISERGGWRRAHVHARNGRHLRTLTPGLYDITDSVKVDEANGLFYFMASPDNAAQRYLYRVPLDGGSTPVRVTPEDQPGTHEYDVSPDGAYAFRTWSAFDKPPVTELIRLPSHEVIRAVEPNRALHQRMKAADLRPTEFLQIDIEDDVTVDAWLMKPPEFDPSKKYPVVVYVYSEPHAQTVLDAWGRVHAPYHRLISDLGYLILSIDSRGTPAPKGAAWRRAVFGSLGPLSTKEQAAALRELARQRSYVDLDRVGIWGWSGGGSNTLNAMFREPDLYDVGIAVASKPQPHLYNAWFQEIYMRTREVNAEGYQRSAPINFAEGLKGDLLIIHGTGEFNTHVQIVEGLVDRLVELGKRFDYTTYPNRRHGMREGRGTVVHLRSQMIRYWLDHLPSGPR